MLHGWPVHGVLGVGYAARWLVMIEGREVEGGWEAGPGGAGRVNIFAAHMKN